MKVSTVRANTRLILFLLAMILLLPFQVLAIALSSRIAHHIPLLFHRICARILGIEIRVHGSPSFTPSSLFVSNHSSYLDIMILGTLLPASFIAKSEISSWPVFGLLGKLQRSVFIVRDPKQALQQTKKIEDRLKNGDSLILFAEGTTSDGNRTMPFKSSLFGVAQFAKTVQPVSIVFTELDRIPAGRTLRHVYAWYGDMDLAPHLMEVLRLGDLTIDIIFHDPIPVTESTNRKILAQSCYDAVSKGVSDLVRGQAAI